MRSRDSFEIPASRATAARLKFKPLQAARIRRPSSAGISRSDSAVIFVCLDPAWRRDEEGPVLVPQVRPAVATFQFI